MVSSSKTHGGAWLLLAVASVACGSQQAPSIVAPAASTAPPQPPAPDPAAALASRIDTLFASFASGHTPGCGAGVYRAGEVLFARGYGYADLEHDVPITDSTVFPIASVSKQFTAAAVLLLAGEGKLSLDDDVRRFVPELPDYGKRITLRHLLHHTSGVRDAELLLELEGRDSDVVTSADLLWLLSHQRALNFPPGSAFEYSNSGYVLLSLVVERASGQTFSAFLRERVFGPLGMDASSVQQDHQRIVPGRAIGYVPRPDGSWGISMSHREYTGPTNVLTTLRDLARWDANFYAPKVGGQGLVDGLRTRDPLDGGAPIPYAMGLYVGEGLGRRSEWHAGGAWGYRSVLTRYPGERLTVSVLCNDASAKPAALEEQIAKLLLPAIEAPLSPPQAPDPAVTGKAAPFTGFQPTSLAEYAGRYGSDELTRDVAIVVEDGKLHVGAWGGTPRKEPLEPIERDVFRQGDLGVSFERNAQGRVVAVVFDTERTRRVRLQRR